MRHQANKQNRRYARGSFYNNRGSRGSVGNGKGRGNFNNNNRGNRGSNNNNRGNSRGSNNNFKGGGKRSYTPFNAKSQQKFAKAAQATLKGKNCSEIINNRIAFLVDSGATEHIVNKGFILQNFEKCSGAFIKSANKNKSADIEIDGKGDLYTNILDERGYPIELTNVIATKNISENLLSLRHFAEAGFCIYLNDYE